MSGIIHLLDDATIGKIAAGEVVERPSSVLKELIENALDAHATLITIEIEDGGATLMRITDNGDGFAREDIPMAFTRHATSKLRKIEDLEHIASYGFRGEALYSIAAVSKTELITKRPKDSVGSRIYIEGGIMKPIQDAGCPNGSTLIIRDLFYNVPARRKFLKSKAAETGQISVVVSRMILANTHVSFRLIQHGKYIYNSPGDGNLTHAVLSVFGKETGEALFPVDERAGNIAIHGCLGKPNIARNNRRQEIFFVNNRWIQNSRIEWAVEQAYGTALMQHRFPFCILYIEIPQDQIDINVHPNKTQIRFMQESETIQILLRLLRNAVNKMMGSPAVYSVPVNSEFEEKILSHKQAPVIKPIPLQSNTANPEETTTFRTAYASIERPESHTGSNTSSAYREAVLNKEKIRPYNYREVLKNTSKNAAPLFLRQDMSIKEPEQTSFSNQLPDESKIRVLGTLFSTYLLLQAENTFLIIDQHAAHERLLYDRYCASVSHGVSLSQQLLIPQIIEVTYDEKLIIEEKKDLLIRSGFELEEYGRLSYQIRAVPQVFGQAQAQYIVIYILRMLQKEGKGTDEDVLARIAQTACKHAIKAGDELDSRQIQILYRQIIEEGVSLTCPHGRPICIQITKTQIEKMFMRIQP